MTGIQIIGLILLGVIVLLALAMFAYVLTYMIVSAKFNAEYNIKDKFNLLNKK